MKDGYIKLWRKSRRSRVFVNPNLWKVWCWCLMKANHEGAWVSVSTGKGTKEIYVKPGQFIFGRKTASKELHMKPSSVRNYIKKLKDIGNLDTQPDTHCTIITIINWPTYQGNKNEVDRQEDNQRTTKGHRQELKEVYSCEFFSIKEKHHEKYQQAYPTVDLMAEYKRMAAWLVSNPKKRKTPRGYPRFVNNWLSEAYDKKKDSSDWRDKLKPL